MKRYRFLLFYLLQLLAQIILGSYANLSQYAVLCFLPVMVLCLPVSMGPIASMLIAFASSFAVDFLTTGMLGMTAIALLPVALCRLLVLRFVFGSDMLARGENVSMRRHGLPKIALASLVAESIFFAIHTVVDCAGTRSFTFCLLRFVLSVLVSTIVSLFIAYQLTMED